MFWTVIGIIIGLIVLFIVGALLISSIIQKKLGKTLVSDEVREFERLNAVSPEQKRWLVFGVPLMYDNLESPHVFALMHADKNQQDLVDGLAEMWKVTDRESTIETLELLSSSEVNSSVAKEIFTNFIVTFDKMEDGHIDTYKLKSEFNMSWEQLSDLDLNELKASYNYSRANSASFVKEFIETKAITDENEIEQITHQAALEYLVILINRNVKAYESAYYTLTSMKKEHRYTKLEIESIQNFEAWDYGRVAFVARNSAALGYITEAEAMPYLKTAAENASKQYSSWREYIAAYYLGRALAYGGGLDAFVQVEVLFNKETNPFEGISFK